MQCVRCGRVHTRPFLRVLIGGLSVPVCPCQWFDPKNPGPGGRLVVVEDDTAANGTTRFVLAS